MDKIRNYALGALYAGAAILSGAAFATRGHRAA
jgi:hypothetical protein